MVDGLGRAWPEDLGLHTPLQKILHLQAQDAIQLYVILVQHPEVDQLLQQDVAFQQPLWGLLVQCQQLPGSLVDLSQVNLTLRTSRLF